jgi:glycosyltransferase involved in cell wall biosynthesis
MCQIKNIKINLVTVSSGWILQKIAERMAANAPNGVEYHISNQPRSGYQYYYYCDIQNCYHGYKQYMPGAVHVGYITHAHENDPEWLKKMFAQQGAWTLDGIKSMNLRYTEMCKDIGWTKPIVTYTPPAAQEHFKLRKTRIVIANRGGYPGYGHDFMLNLPKGSTKEQEEEGYVDILKDFHFTFLGNGWDPVVDKYIKLGIDTVHVSDDGLNYPQDYELFYHQADYLLVPILWTAGPYCAMEAHLCGLPIIASDVGLINYEIVPEHSYAAGDTEALRDILSSIHLDKLSRRINIIEGIGGWKKYTKNVTDFIRRCANE